MEIATVYKKFSTRFNILSFEIYIDARLYVSKINDSEV